jgi:hypothetical protein
MIIEKRKEKVKFKILKPATQSTKSAAKTVEEAKAIVH